MAIRITPSYTSIEVGYTLDRATGYLRLLTAAESLVREYRVRHRDYEQSITFTGLTPATSYFVEITDRSAGRDRQEWARARTLSYPALSGAPAIRAWTPIERDSDQADGLVELSWTWTGAYANQYQTRVRAAAGSDWQDASPTALGRISGRIRGGFGLSVDVQVRVLNPSSQSDWSAAVRITYPKRYDRTLGTPAVQGVPTANSVQWQWLAIAGAATYRLDYLTAPLPDPGAEYEDEARATRVAGIATPSYDQTGLQPGADHPVRVRAETGSRYGPWSAWVRVRTLGSGQPQALVLSAYAQALEAAWLAPADGAPAYDVRWKDQAVATWGDPVRTADLLHRITGVRAGVVYDVAVRAVPAQGSASAWTSARGSLAEAGPRIARLSPARNEYFAQLAGPVDWAPDYYESRLRHGDQWGPVRRRDLSWAQTGLIGQTAYVLQVRARSTPGLMSAWVEQAFQTQIGGGLAFDRVLPAPTRAGLHMRLRTAAGAIQGAGPLPVYDVDMRMQVDIPMTWSAAVPLAAEEARWPHMLDFQEPGSDAFLDVGLIDTVRTQIAPAQHRRLLSGLGHMAELGAIDVPADWMGSDIYAHATALDRLADRAPDWTFVSASDPPIDTLVWEAKQQTLQEALRTLALATGTHFIAAGFRIVRFFGAFVDSPYVLSLLGEDDPSVLALDAFDAAFEYYNLSTRVYAVDAAGNGLDAATAALPTPEGYVLDADRRTLINAPLEARIATQRVREMIGTGSGADALLLQARAFLRRNGRPQTTYQCAVRQRQDRYLPPLIGRRVMMRLRDEQGASYQEEADVHEVSYRIAAGERRIALTLAPTGGHVRPRSDQQLADWLGAP